MNLDKSPLAPASFPSMPPLAGFDLFVGTTGVKYKNRPDVLLIKLAPEAKVAGVFTRNSAPGAPVEWSKTRLAAGAKGGILVTSGNANVFTGAQGLADVQSLAGWAARALLTTQEDIYVCSTGVIGEPLVLEPYETLFSTGLTKAGWLEAARAIGTTDTFPKGATRTCTIDGQRITLCGIAKGSGMIAPDMATMLAFLFTDAHIKRPVLQGLLSDLCETSFNAITVDSDTSTSDTVLLAASALANHSPISNVNDPRLDSFKQALANLMKDLAHQVIKDGEGASKFITVKVKGAKTDRSAKAIAMSIANSPLVKTAIAGEDANWGRIVMAVGKSGEPADRDLLSIAFGPHILAQNGMRAPGYDENIVSTYMKNDHLEISVDIGLGAGQFTVWTCDLTHGYIDINADYRS